MRRDSTIPKCGEFPYILSMPDECKRSQVYEDIIKTAERRIYDPDWLGDLPKLYDKYNCRVKNADDAIAYADKALKLPKDPYADVYPKPEAERMARDWEGKREAVRTKALPNNVSYISLSTFDQRDAAQELKTAIEAAPNAAAYIIDLRNNTGGSVDQALMSASLFLGEGRLLSQRRRVASPADAPQWERITYDLTDEKIDVRRFDDKNGEENPIQPDLTRYPDLVDKPVVILVDKNTASAAELFTAALRENRVATVIGEQTFGKGIGQTLFKDMPNSSWLRLTTFRYFTPNGHWLGDGAKEKHGIRPDIEVALPRGVARGSDQDAQLNTALDYLAETRRQRRN